MLPWGPRTAQKALPSGSRTLPLITQDDAKLDAHQRRLALRSEQDAGMGRDVGKAPPAPRPRGTALHTGRPGPGWSRAELRLCACKPPPRMASEPGEVMSRRLRARHGPCLARFLVLMGEARQPLFVWVLPRADPGLSDRVQQFVWGVESGPRVRWGPEREGSGRFGGTQSGSRHRRPCLDFIICLKDPRGQ